MSVATIDNIGGVKLVDINPNKSTDTSAGVYHEGFLYLYCESSIMYACIPCCGYKKVAFYKKEGSTHTVKISFQLDDGSFTSEVTLPDNSWTTYYDVPLNAIAIRAGGIRSGSGVAKLLFSMIA